MYKLHKIDEDAAKNIAKQETGEDINKFRLSHRAKLLIYHIHTKNYVLEINALDGKITKKIKNY